MEPLALSDGQQIGDWVVIGPLGRGGMGSVYRCHSTLSEQVQAAVKVLDLVDTPSTSDAVRARFVRELEVLSALDHPAIVRVLGGGVDAGTGTTYLVMELVQGSDLTGHIDGGQLSWQAVAQIGRDAAVGLAAAHAAGVAHRDSKPANLMLTDAGQVKLIDFGIAYQDGQPRLTRHRTVPGTMAYMPPEVFAAGSSDPMRGDLYSLGQCLYEALTGVPAYPEDLTLTQMQQYAAILGAKARDVCLDPGPDVPEALRDLIRSLTARDPADRIQGAASVAAAFGHLLGDEPAPPFPTPTVPPRERDEQPTFAFPGPTLAEAQPAPAPPKRFPAASLVASALLAAAPPLWLVVWVVVMIPFTEVGAFVVAVTLLVAPLTLPVVAVLGLATTLWFTVRVWSRSRVPLLWWVLSAVLGGVHAWHLFLAIADAAWLVSLAQQVAEEHTWSDLIGF